MKTNQLSPPSPLLAKPKPMDYSKPMDDSTVTRSKLGASAVVGGSHTPEPWIIVPQSDGSAMIALEFETGKQMNPKGLRLIAHVLARGNTLEQDEANARRIVACVNAAEGISTEALEASKDFAAAGIATVRSVEAQRDELAEALRELVACKDMKDRIDANFGKTVTYELANLSADYECRKPFAWKAARAVLRKLDTGTDVDLAKNE